MKLREKDDKRIILQRGHMQHKRGRRAWASSVAEEWIAPVYVLVFI